jgi:hypothetical protein
MKLLMTKRKSLLLRWLKNELREEALKTEDEVLKKKLWRWYYRAQAAESEVNELVLQAEIRRLIELLIVHKIIDPDRLNIELERADDIELSEDLPKAKKSKRKKKAPSDDNLPKQKGFWDETES